MRVYKYDVSGVDLTDCDKLILMPLHVDTIPMIMGVLKAITWRRRHENDQSHEVACAVYQEIEEIFIVNDCITDKLQELIDALLPLDYLQCLCEQATAQNERSTSGLEEQVYINVAHNPDVDFTGDEEPNYEIGEVPEIYNGERCQRAQAVWSNIFEIASRVASLQLGVGGVASGSIVALVGGFLAVPVPISIVVGLVAGLAYILIEDSVLTGLADWEGAEQEAVCTIYNSVDMSTAQDAMHSLIDTVVTTATARAYLKVWYGSVLMGSMWQDPENWETFDADYCLACDPIPDGCVGFLPCDIGDWDGGTISCVGGVPVLTGGETRYTLEALPVPLGNAQVRLVWISRGTPPGQGAVNVRLHRLSDGTDLLLGNSGLQDFDEEIESVFAVPSWYSSSGSQIRIGQANYSAELLYWCVEET